ncbi:Triacylglycerol lipase [Aspergillus sp. HF37]|nr:Triacylglycerol lipase [Aspergillus sp. HF37]
MGHSVASNATKNLKPIRSKYTSQPVYFHRLRYFHSIPPRNSPRRHPHILEPRLDRLGKVIKDEYAVIRDRYATPAHPIVLAHGLFGFDELRLAGPYLPGVQYWRGIKEALSIKGVEVITATVPPSGSIEARAEELARDIAAAARGRKVNIIAHLKPNDFRVASLTTIATPHRGSAVADYIFEQIGDEHIHRVYNTLGRLSVETAGFAQLTRKYMEEKFNPTTPDVDDIRYVSAS